MKKGLMILMIAAFAAAMVMFDTADVSAGCKYDKTNGTEYCSASRKKKTTYSGSSKKKSSSSSKSSSESKKKYDAYDVYSYKDAQSFADDKYEEFYDYEDDYDDEDEAYDAADDLIDIFESPDKGLRLKAQIPSLSDVLLKIVED
ncbi:MAG: hypothetical protein K5770_10810 [Lachnospiraceae bacterium]|nr:hypothetical protein [Lachnospiraceae bacterium]